MVGWELGGGGGGTAGSGGPGGHVDVGLPALWVC